MKNKYLKIYLGISVFLILFLGLYIYYPSIFCEKEHFKDVSESRNMVPDEETAVKIAYIFAEEHLGFDVDYYYEPAVRFDESRNEWCVDFLQMVPGKSIYVLGGGRVIAIEKDTGVVTQVYRSFC
ncbi:MAG: hypothetical protein IJO65_02060 [Lachnospiraceae bacterium]|nr:hypothetical protein [Lachnospiraceae bacterium]